MTSPSNAETNDSSAVAVCHQDMANAIRALAMDAVEQANSGHPGMPMGMADVATVLFSKFLRFDAGDPDWFDRDRFVLSAGHGSMLLYALLHLTGYPKMTIEQIRNFRQWGSITPGHPEVGHTPGVETTTGPLGQGFATAVGMALAERHLAARFGRDLVDHWTYVIASDGDLMEGISHEAAALAGHQKLGRLIVLYDDNQISIDGPTSLAMSTHQLGRFQAYGWHVMQADGHDPDEIEAAIDEALGSDRPSLIACRTVIGKGSPGKAGTAGVHGAPLGAEEIEAARRELGWHHPPFEIPASILQAWREVGRRQAETRQEWQARLDAAPEKGAFVGALSAPALPSLQAALDAHKKRLAEERPGWATRKASQEALEVFTEAVPELVGGSADLTGSNLTKTKALTVQTADQPGGRYIHYGVREHGMAAAMNGMALHGGVIPYGGTFLIFTDYCRPAIRLSALMQQRVIYVMTHDSIGLGEDGPTHQPIEQLPSLRAIPGLWVMRPADAIETAECWALAIARHDGPSVLALTRQGVPTMRDAEGGNLSAKGGYVIKEADGQRRATLIATGSEVSIALDAAKALEADGIATAVVSMPCQELFDQQDVGYRQSVLGEGLRLAIEAASPYGWGRYVGDEERHVIAIHGFGASAPYKELYERFGITAEAIAARVRESLG
ncbi:MAG: transketolase [Alphaproteobacteria bacterium]